MVKYRTRTAGGVSLGLLDFFQLASGGQKVGSGVWDGARWRQPIYKSLTKGKVKTVAK